jgi:glutamyl-Q tRNA(Asp) synthetase
VAVDRFGYKLSKQSQAEPINYRQPAPTLLAALRFLGQNPPPELANARLDEIWSWALANWRPEWIPALTTIGWTQTPMLESAPATVVTKDF